MRVPVELEKAVREAARAVLGEAPLATGPLARAIVDRSQRYTSDRDRLAQPRDADGDLAARAAFFTIADAMKIALPLAELASRDALPAARPIRIVDVGAGCGAMTLGTIAALDPALALDITAIDRDARALEIAGKAVRGFAGARQITFLTKSGDAVHAPLPHADLVLMGTVLNELAPDAALGLVERALANISDDGAVIIVEPALRDTSRALHAIRDAVISRQESRLPGSRQESRLPGSRQESRLPGSKGAHVFAPCTRRCVPCTALVDPSDWCHEDRALELPPITAGLARLTHLRDSGMKFSYLVLRKQPLDLVVAGPNAWRVVSAPFVAKGKRELIGCSERGRVTLRLLKRNRTEANREFERADRGDVLVTDAAPDDKRLEVTDEMAVERIDRLPR